MSLNNLIPLKNGLKQNVKFQSVSDMIEQHLKLIPEIETLKMSIELINYVCNLIEHLIKHKYKINKVNLLIYTLKRCVEINDEQEDIIKQTITYLHENKLIKKVSRLCQVFVYSKELLKKQF